MSEPLKQRLLELLNTSSARGMKSRASYILQVFDWSDSIEQVSRQSKEKT